VRASQYRSSDAFIDARIKARVIAQHRLILSKNVRIIDIAHRVAHVVHHKTSNIIMVMRA